VFRGWDATLFFEGQNIRIEPTEGSKKEKRTVAVSRQTTREGGADTLVNHWKDFLNCVRTRETPQANIDLAYHVQTALQMGMLSLRSGKAIKFDAENEKIVV
jgi:predicted dehydrogenase